MPVQRPPVLDRPAFGPDPVAVARAYGLGDLRVPPQFAARGELGRVWRFTTSSGDWAVKELLTDLTEAEARLDVDFQNAAHANGVTMPVPRLRTDGPVLLHVSEASGRTPAVRVYSWVDLAPGPVSASPAQAADQLGRLHAVAFPDRSAPDPWFWEPFDDARWQGLVELAHRAGASWADSLGAMVPALVSANSLVRAGAFSPDVRCHLDYNPQNVLLGRDGGPIVVDWENSGPATVEQELASAVAEFVPDPEDLPAFLDAYLGAGGVPVPLSPSSFTMTLAVQAHLLAWYCDRALDPRMDTESRARAAYWVEDICGALFTVDRVSAWVDAAGRVLGTVARVSRGGGPSPGP